jgi:hypothetical protein
MDDMSLLLAAAGVFTLVLGIVHFFFPILLDFDQAIPRQGDPALRALRIGPMTYATQRSDVYGVAWVMNHAASYVLVSMGIADLAASYWLGAPVGRWLALWIAGWWFLRAASQLYLGRRRGDWIVVVWFALLGLLHVAAARWT